MDCKRDGEGGSMATYTMVVVAPNELSQDDVIQLAERIGIVVFCGPGSLVQDVDPETGEPAREMVPRQPEEVTVGLDGLMAKVQVLRAEDGTPLLHLEGVNCRLDGDCPGDYYLLPDSST